MPWTTLQNSLPSRRRLDSAWPARPSACSHEAGHVDKRLMTTLRYLLTWVSIFASIWIYYELALTGHRAWSVSRPPSQPVLLPGFPKDLVQFPRVWLRAQAKIVFKSEHEVGGHFVAYEQASALVGDLRKMFGKYGPSSREVSVRVRIVNGSVRTSVFSLTL
ncbi:hypothetical protein EDB89DRAFT_1367861 [Lactarius sanguifluus]|nr:hypothetical protein EDB89DRAFT_1367861 [Lactarius sanguifluus]